MDRGWCRTKGLQLQSVALITRRSCVSYCTLRLKMRGVHVTGWPHIADRQMGWVEQVDKGSGCS